jgi:hypothetical protein
MLSSHAGRLLHLLSHTQGSFADCPCDPFIAAKGLICMSLYQKKPMVPFMYRDLSNALQFFVMMIIFACVRQSCVKQICSTHSSIATNFDAPVPPKRFATPMLAFSNSFSNTKCEKIPLSILVDRLHFYTTSSAECVVQCSGKLVAVTSMSLALNSKNVLAFETTLLSALLTELLICFLQVVFLLSFTSFACILHAAPCVVDFRKHFAFKWPAKKQPNQRRMAVRAAIAILIAQAPYCAYCAFSQVCDKYTFDLAKHNTS